MQLLHRIFLNQYGMRAGWRLAVWLSVAMLICLFVTGDPIAGGISPRLYHGQPRMILVYGLPIIDISRPFSFFALFAASIYVAVFLERRPIRSLGLGFSRRWWKEFLGGLALGLSLLSTLIGSLVAFGAYRFSGLPENPGEALRWGVSIGLVCLGIALMEEYGFRGYLLQTLIQGVGFPAALVISCAAFLAIHVHTQGESPIGLAEIVLFAILALILILRTRSLWAAVGLHTTWDWSQNFLYNTPDSGVNFPGGLLHLVRRGPDWLSGGSVGPEGSVLAVILTLAAIVFLLRTKWIQPSPESLHVWERFITHEKITAPVAPPRYSVLAIASVIPVLLVIPSFPNILPRGLPAAIFVIATAIMWYKAQFADSSAQTPHDPDVE